jgi:hypothetical protein
MLASTQPVLHLGTVPPSEVLGSRWIPGEGCRIGRHSASATVLEEYGISIADAKAGVVEASHQ